jgi:hypothetical protein
MEIKMMMMMSDITVKGAVSEVTKLSFILTNL